MLPRMRVLGADMGDFFDLKRFCIMAAEFGPEMRIKLMAPAPRGVAIAAIVSFVRSSDMCGRFTGENTFHHFEYYSKREEGLGNLQEAQDKKDKVQDKPESIFVVNDYSSVVADAFADGFDVAVAGERHVDDAAVLWGHWREDDAFARFEDFVCHGFSHAAQGGFAAVSVVADVDDDLVLVFGLFAEHDVGEVLEAVESLAELADDHAGVVAVEVYVDGLAVHFEFGAELNVHFGEYGFDEFACEVFRGGVSDFDAEFDDFGSDEAEEPVALLFEFFDFDIVFGDAKFFECEGEGFFACFAFLLDFLHIVLPGERLFFLFSLFLGWRRAFFNRAELRLRAGL